MFVATGSVQAPMQPSAVIVEKIKHKHSQKESNFPLPSLTSALPPCSRPLEFIQPLATRAEAWQAIPGVSEWVMGIMKQGYSLQFARRSPRFSGVVSTSVQGENARVLRSEVMTLLEKGAIEMVPPALSESGFYSRYFLVPKKDGGLRPILDLRRLNHALMRRLFRMITLKQILSQIRTGDWFCSLDLKDAYFHIQIAPHHRRFLRFAFEGVGLPVHGPTLWAVSGPPYFYEVHGRGSFPSETDGNPHSQLPQRLAHSGPVRGGTTFTQNPHPQPLRAPGAQGQFRQKRTVSQPTSIVPGYSSGLSSHESGDSARTRSGHSETRGHFQERHRSPTQSVSENAGPYGRSIASVTAGPAPYAPPSTLVETTGSTQRMASRTLAYQGESGLCDSPDPLEEPTVDEEGRGHGVGPHQESCHDRRLQHRLGGAVRRQADLRPLVEGGERLPHQLLGNASSLSSLPVFPAGPNRTPCSDSLRQHVRGVLYKSPGRCLLEAPLYSGRAPSGMGSAQPALAEGSTPAGQTEPRSGYVISEQCPLRGVDAPSAGGSEDLEDLWQGRSRPFRLQRQLSLPNLLFEGQGRVGPRLAQPPPLCIPPDCPASTGRQACQGTGSQGAIGGPLVEEPTLVVRADSATDSSPLARAPETGSPLSGERNNMAPPARAVGSLHLAAQREPTGLPERVLNTISEARAPSTRRLYALKWSVFSSWCLNRGENPSTSELAVVLSFLQELLDKGHSHSTLKVFVAAIAAFHAPIAGQSVGRDNSVVRFLKGARRLNPPRPLTVPTWDLPTVLRALKGPPFEPLQSTNLHSLSLKTALLLALASVKRVGDLQALSISPACLEFGPNDSKVVLKPRHGYVPKVLSTPFRAQVITLSALPPSEEDRELSLLCPVRALRIYFERSAPFRHAE